MVKRWDDFENGCIPMHCGANMVSDVLFTFIWQAGSTLLNLIALYYVLRRPVHAMRTIE